MGLMSLGLCFLDGDLLIPNMGRDRLSLVGRGSVLGQFWVSPVSFPYQSRINFVDEVI